jgi:hypothetical protein
MRAFGLAAGTGVTVLPIPNGVARFPITTFLFCAAEKAPDCLAALRKHEDFLKLTTV